MLVSHLGLSFLLLRRWKILHYFYFTRLLTGQRCNKTDGRIPQAYQQAGLAFAEDVQMVCRERAAYSKDVRRDRCNVGTEEGKGHSERNGRIVAPAWSQGQPNLNVSQLMWTARWKSVGLG